MGYLENLWNALDFGSLRDMVLRLVSVFLCLTARRFYCVPRKKFSKIFSFIVSRGLTNSQLVKKEFFDKLPPLSAPCTKE